MAYYAALVSVVQSLEKMSNRDRYPKFLLDKEHITSVYEKLGHLQELLEDYSSKDKEATDCLERRIRDVAYRVQEILESQDIIEYNISNPIYSKDRSHGVKNVIRRLRISMLKRAMPRQLQDLEEVKKEVDSIVEEVNMMRNKKSNTTIQDLKLKNYYTASEQESRSCGDAWMGLNEPLTTIKDQLCGESSKLEVVPLVGMGGMGKTTLARSAFNDKLVEYHIDLRAWVTVSQNYHWQNVRLEILKSMNVNTEKLSAKELDERIYKYLKGRRYLIIIDGIWDTTVWDDMKRIFPDDNNRSRIILTTRLSHVAVYAKRCGSFHQMQFLNEDQSWKLLRQKVFGQEECPQELEVIGRLIAKDCGGLPLAIVVVAGLLSKVNTIRHGWDEIARNVSSAATENDGNLSKLLSLSYNHLPNHLKPCFLYMGGFPEDYKIRVSKLIKLWVAEGFLKPDDFKSLEEIGEEYLEDLVKRNLVLINKKSSQGKIKYCSIHDVLRDLCVKRARYESFLHVVDDDVDYLGAEGTRHIVRHLCIHSSHPRIMKEEICGSYVRSILCFCNITKSLSLLWGFKLLKVLDAQKLVFYSFPDEVLELFHLRFLALVADGMFYISPRITKLEKLQTLVIKTPFLSGAQIIMITFEIWRMPQLRHVVFSSLGLSCSIPFACILPNLQTLSCLVNFVLTSWVIRMIPNLQRLKVAYTSEQSEPWNKFCLYNLVQFCQLEKLRIYFLAKTVEKLSFNRKKFAFPHKLKKLTLLGCQFHWKDMTVVGSLPNLEVLKLQRNSFLGDEWEPTEGEFLQLKFLLMCDLNLKYWLAEQTHFPRLEHLKIYYCDKLKEIPLEIGDITTLKLIEVCANKSISDSALRIQEDQQDNGNDGLQVHVYPCDEKSRRRR